MTHAHLSNHSLAWDPQVFQVLPCTQLSDEEKELAARDATIFKIVYEQKLGRELTHKEKMTMIYLVMDCYEKGVRDQRKVALTCIYYLPGFEDERDFAFEMLQDFARLN